MVGLECVFADGNVEQWATARLDVRDYERLSGYIEEICGICIPPNKQILLESRLRRRLRALGMNDFSEYCQHVLSSNQGLDEIVLMVNEITTNKTDFFRESFHFDYLTQQAIPELIKSAAGSRPPLQVWSAGCSSGEEAYTMAMVLAEYALSHPGFRYSILGTDICTDVLEQAKRGIYPEERIEPVPAVCREKYLLRSKNHADHLVRVSPHIRANVRFRRLNFRDRDYAMEEQIDVVFCRNVFIYFSRETQEVVCNRICRCLRPGGYFFLGHAETFQGLKTPLRPVAPTVYRKEA
jgi:chemotaxis protein methyltransferase CheR